MRNEYSKTAKLAMLLEMSLNMSEEERRAMDKRDSEKAMYIIELKDCIDKLMDYLEGSEQ